MRQRRKGLVTVGVLALLATSLMAMPSAGAAAATCDDAYVHIDGDTVTVSPTGTDDTANLQCALDVAASLPWAHVVLEAGDYSTSFLEVEGFHGVLEGAGQDETTVMTLPEGLDCIAQSQARRVVSLIVFGSGDVEVRDLSIAVGGRTSCEAPWVSQENDDGSGWVAWDLDAALQFAPGVAPSGSCPAAGTQDVSVHHVGIEGIWPDYHQDFIEFRGFYGGLIAGGDALRGCPETRSSGEVLITDSAFARIPQPATVAWLDDSSVAFTANHVRSTQDGPIFQDMSNTIAVVDNNLIEDAWFNGLVGFARPDLAGEHPFTLEIRSNEVAGRAWADGIVIVDNARAVTGQTVVDTVITGNTVTLDNTNRNAILALRAGGGEIVGNTILGAARTGIAVGADRWLVTGNDLSGFDAFLADIWLTADSSRNRVRCSSPLDTVLDEGFRNRVRGCSAIDLPAAGGDSTAGVTGETLPPATEGVKADLEGALVR